MQGIHILYIRVYFSNSSTIIKRYQNRKLSKQLDFLKHRHRHYKLEKNIMTVGSGRHEC